MKSKITKIQTNLVKGVLLLTAIIMLIPLNVYSSVSLTLQDSTALEKLMYGEIGSVVKKIEEHFKLYTTLYIVNETQLRALAEYVNNGSSCDGKIIELLNDINLNTDLDWTPIGNSHSEFSGTFDGNGYVISNLTYKCRENYETEGGYSNIGLFGVVSKNGIIKKVNVTNSIIEANGLSVDNIYNVGNIAGTNYGKILDCEANIMPLSIEEVAEGTKDNNFIGLIAGKNEGQIKVSKTIEPNMKLTLDSNSEANIDIEVYKKEGEDEARITDFSNPTNFKIGETIKLKFIVDKYLYTGLEDGKEIKLSDKLDEEGNVTEEVAKGNYPLVKMRDVKIKPISAIYQEVEIEEGITKPQTVLVYEYTLTAEENIIATNSKISMNFEKNINDQNLYVYYSENSENFYTGDIINKEGETTNLEIYLDSKAPSLKLDAYVEELSDSKRYAEGKEILIKVKSKEKIQASAAPELKVTFSESGLGKYNYQEDSTKGNAVHVDAFLDEEGFTTWVYSYIIAPGDEGILNIEYLSGTITDLVGNTTNITENEKEKVVICNNIYADTTAPMAQIEVIDVQNSITNKDIIEYEIKWNEEVIEFDISDITVNNGTVIELAEKIEEEAKEEPEEVVEEEQEKTVEVKEKTYSYIVKVDTSIENGNVGDLQLVIEQGACKDLVGHSNIRAENVIKIDKRAPILLNLEAYSKLEGTTNLDNNYYKAGDKVEIVATFDESITLKKQVVVTEEELIYPSLNIQFSDSGKAKGNIEKKLDGNKIVYTYTIANGDKGELSINSFSGIVKDIVGNETQVTKRELIGDTIISDTTVPELIELKVTNAEEYYGVNSEIKIEAIYSEDIYNLYSLVSDEMAIQHMPELKLAFGEIDARGEVAVEYAKKEDGSIDKSKLIYTYIIKGEETIQEEVEGEEPKTKVVPGDNGTLTIKSYTKKKVDILDIAGNEAILNVKQTGDQVIADTIRPVVTSINAQVINPIVLDTGDYYKAGNEVKIKVEFDEKVHVEQDIEPKILVGFSEVADQEPAQTNYKEVSYKPVLNPDTNEIVETDEIEVIYTISENDNGYLWVKVLENQFADQAGNKNVERVTYNKVVLDFTKPVIRAKVNGGNYVIGTDNKKAILKETIVVDEDLASFEYAWSTYNKIEEITKWSSVDVSEITVNGDINLETETQLEEVTEETYYLYIRAKDIAGNLLEVRTKAFIVSDSKITLTPDITQATNKDVTVAVTYGKGLTQDLEAGISGKTQSADSSKVIVTENGIVYAQATDIAGNKVYSTLEINYIDKVVPEATITYIKNEDNSVTAKIEFNEENVIITNNEAKDTYVFTENGEFTFEFKDVAGNEGKETAVVTNINPEKPKEDKTAPTIRFNYTTTTITLGTTINTTVTTDEESKISYSWDNKNWITSQDYVISQEVTYKPTQVGTYTLYVKAEDKSGNASKVQTLQYTVVNSVEDIKTPEIILEGLPIIQVDGVQYVKVSADITTEDLTSKMSTEALCGKTPEYTKLTEDKKVKTGSEITLNGDCKYVIVVNGDINGDGKIDFLNDIITANNYRIGVSTLSTMQKIAADIDNNGKVEFISDILAMNNYRIGITSSL